MLNGKQFRKVICIISDVGANLSKFVLLINLACCLCYAVIWIILKTSSLGKKGRSKVTQRIFKSLVMILLVSVLPWAMFMVFRASINPIQLSSIGLWYASSIFGSGVLLGSTADLLILYLFSTEYRAAIRRHIFKTDQTSFSNITQVKSNTNLT
uniref:Uncharacterized protein n=1 Tax=Ditylenchus dipsaci TaxID=166011 RepID=A0A915E8B1_9BILA